MRIGDLVYIKRYGNWAEICPICTSKNALTKLNFIRIKLDRRKEKYLKWFKEHNICVFKLVSYTEIGKNKRQSFSAKCIFCGQLLNSSGNHIRTKNVYVEKIPAEHFTELAKEFKVKLLWI